MFVRVFLCALMAGVVGVASAQTQPAAAQQQPAATQQRPAAPQLTPEQRAAIQKQNQELAAYAETIAKMVDNGQAGQVWDQASDVAKRAVTRDQFIKATEADRARHGKVASRKLVAVTRSISEGGELPAGQYTNVHFATQFGSNAQPVRELVSFHLDTDKKWRLSGYTLRQPAAAPASK